MTIHTKLYTAAREKAKREQRAAEKQAAAQNQADEREGLIALRRGLTHARLNIDRALCEAWMRDNEALAAQLVTTRRAVTMALLYVEIAQADQDTQEAAEKRSDARA